MTTLTATQSIDIDNIHFKRALAFVQDTNENIFLTGKAGTGKTTFLKYIKNNINKQCAVIAPTGVAAINAGGETIHSFLQLPFTPFVPGNAQRFSSLPDRHEDKHSLLANLRLKESKRKLLQRLELLVIDEVSMVRCDLLDAIDLVLRHTRRNMAEPFGGLQVVFVGDMFQLPPVVPDTDWEILSNYYASPYFFDAQVLQYNPPTYIELKKIYRQKEETFINILNKIRMGQVSQPDIDLLNEKYNPDIQSKKNEGYIILSTHNHTVDKINQKALEELSAPLHTFEGIIKNDFNPKNLPTEEILQLKEGAQVMFVKNDTQTPRRYYNGKIGIVDTIDDKGIKITFADEIDKAPLVLEQETWKNMRYKLNSDKGEVDEEEAGTFTQYPVRLAWAVTVHKSQGLTFDKVIVDLNRSFAPGQVYVALSRCTTLQGLALSSRLNMSNVMIDERIISFAKSEKDDNSLDDQLAQSTRLAQFDSIRKSFLLTDLIISIEQLNSELGKKKTGPTEENRDICLSLISTLTQANKHAENFGKELYAIMDSGDNERLTNRKTAATAYFSTQVLEPCIQRIEQHLVLLSGYKRVLKQTMHWKEMKTLFQNKVKAISNR